MQEKDEKNPEKIFKKKGNRCSVQVLPFYMVDALIANYHAGNKPQTVNMLQKKLLTDGKGFYDTKTIRFVLNNLHLYCRSVQLLISRQQIAGTRSHATAFSLKKKNYRQ